MMCRLVRNVWPVQIVRLLRSVLLRYVPLTMPLS
ncbi:unnamed protein product [Nippostrongylus brasiliensis]|uniref:Mobile element protein n=1 Tax=Nippostrongylus brasiliensis TaxID=27835 RepID=A0A0N4XV60_NIPBR|nr:unnamed protein product [Nippostrongylus brasiliensis]